MVWCEAYFDHLNCLGMTQEYEIQGDGWTDILIANIALNYIAWPKKLNFYKLLQTYS